MSPLNVFKALSDETRFRIVHCLLGGELCACVIPRLVGRAQPTVSLQLKKLVKLGVLDSRREGKNIFYRLKDSRIKRLLEIAGAKPLAKKRGKNVCRGGCIGKNNN